MAPAPGPPRASPPGGRGSGPRPWWGAHPPVGRAAAAATLTGPPRLPTPGASGVREAGPPSTRSPAPGAPSHLSARVGSGARAQQGIGKADGPAPAPCPLKLVWHVGGGGGHQLGGSGDLHTRLRCEHQIKDRRRK